MTLDSDPDIFLESMAIFFVISMVQSEGNLQIRNGFIRMLAAESARLGADTPLIPELEDGISVRQRYAPMQRLLSEDDELFLSRQGVPAAAKHLRQEHRECYFGYVARLTREIRSGRRLRALAMASQQQWSFWVLVRQAAVSESSLLYLRWLGYRHALGITVAARDVRECLDFLIIGPKFHLATT